MFQTTKIQIFESNSQHERKQSLRTNSCFRLQRHKLLKAIHNLLYLLALCSPVVSDYKDTNFWKQFTTYDLFKVKPGQLFQTTKIQTFESNSQLGSDPQGIADGCFRLQRYKLLKAIHNNVKLVRQIKIVVSDSCQYR